jgi:transcriptional regulator with XRE-family HTH domain
MNRHIIHTNGKLLRHLRTSRGWTQKELARRAGYTERLVRKAEHGGSLDFQTAVDLADALSLDTTTIAATDLDLDRSLIWIAERILFGPVLHGTEDLREINLFLSPDFVLHVSGSPSKSIFAGTWKSVSGFRAFLEAFHKTIRRTTQELDVAFTTSELLVSARYRESFWVEGQPVNAFWVNLHFHFAGTLVQAIDVEYDTLSVSESCRERRLALARHSTRLLARRATENGRFVAPSEAH